jgi:hypothetical protein
MGDMSLGWRGISENTRVKVNTKIENCELLIGVEMTWHLDEIRMKKLKRYYSSTINGKFRINLALNTYRYSNNQMG